MKRISTSCKLALVMLCLMFLSRSKASASTTVSANAFIQPKAEQSTLIANASYYLLDTVQIHNLLKGHSHIQISDFPLAEDLTVTLDLKPSRSAFDSKTKCVVATPSGDIEMNAPELLVYRGTVLGEPNSKVMLTYSGIGLLCSIHREDGSDYIFGQLRSSSDMTSYILLPEHELLSSAPFKPFYCMNDGIINQPNALTPVDQIFAEARSHKGGKFGTQAVNTTGLLEAEIAIEADNDFYKAAGNTDAKVLSYIGALFSMSSSIYEDEAHITFRIPWVKVWSTTDPYGVKGDAYALPDKAKNYWIAHYSSVQRDLAHVMTSISYGGGGYGWYSLCDNNQSYSVSSPQTGHSYPTFAFTYDAYIVSHEIGHNFSLVHSHDCYWNPPLDTCHTKDDPNTALQLGDACFSLPTISKKSAGSIMSYCAGTNYTLSGNNFAEYKLDLTFTHRADTVLRANAEKATCITPPTDPTVILTYPRGSATYKGDSTINILWTFAHVSNVSLEYSDNGGTSWNPIKSNVPATDGATTWKLPNATSKKMLVRIFDASAASVADTSLLFFTVNSTVPGAIVITKPSAGEILAPKTAQKIVFAANNTRSPLIVEFSSNNSTWTNVGTIANASDTVYNAWTTPDINSTTCALRIKDGSDAGSIIGKSGVFTIKPTPGPKYSNLSLSGVVGGKIDANTPSQFTWSSEGSVGAGTIQMSTDNATWNDILSVTEANTSALWTTPDTNLPTAYFKITNKNGTENAMTAPVWIYKPSSSVRNIGGTPNKFFLTPNFPNPVKTTTTINFEVPSRALVTLRVHNDLGQVVATLVNESLDAGTYQAMLDVKDLAAGNYNFTLESGTVKLISKMQVVK